ncbi:SRPBCC family protein [Salinibacterium sp. PAMC 21357]|uniref:SRPBCC family protein n=1 Tax=Salinibacterium sp. PAMC 21357 TaxID=1112215 RepID=UPI000287BF43|nr:SRPBCC domain-containing protein [Salinibacterium sp. PAMC 21357]
MSNPVSITRTFAATPEQVFDAWTTPASFAIWFGTAALSVVDVEMDVRVGGTWTATMHLPDGNLKYWAGEYTEVDRPTRLALTLTDEPSEPAGDPVTVDIVAVNGGTEMTMVQSGQGFDEEGKAAVTAGYNAFFDDMEKLLAG